MRALVVPLILCAACSPSPTGDAGSDDAIARSYATQTTAPSPDYRLLLMQAPLGDGRAVQREPTASMPPNAKAIGDEWLTRLKERSALLGYGLAGKDSDGPVNLIDIGMTEAAFDRWTRENGWQAPTHINWSFVPEMRLPPVSEAARHLIRVWPASRARTGAQNEALFRGHVELRDGCFFVGEFGQPADKLAWFHAEIGIDRDPAGYFVLRNRVSGQTLARLGEAMSWGGPASAEIDVRSQHALREACGLAEIYVVGSPEASERFLTQNPQLRIRGAVRPPFAPHSDR